jgi:hypothetical protein
MTTQKYLLGSSATIIGGAALQALTNNSLVAGSSFNNTAGATGDGYILCRITADFKFQSAPTANTGLSVWFLRARDPSSDSNYEDGSSSVTPARAPDIVFPVSADTNAHRVTREVVLPPGYITPLLKNDGTGQTLTNNSTDNTLIMTPVTYQIV